MKKHNRRLVWAGIFLVSLILTCLLVSEFIALVATAHGG
jgi:hypothetical protein